MNILSLLRALSRRNIRGGRRPGRTPIRKPTPYRPRIETLEDRSMLSSIQMLPLGDGTFQLRVDGDAKANQVSLVGQAPVAQTNDYSLVVTCDQLKQTVDHVSELVIDTAGGADTVLLTGQWAFQGKGKTMPGVQSISVNTGGGDDEVRFIDFSGQSVNGIVPGPHIEIDTGSGNDLAWFRPIFHPPTLFAGLELFVRTGGGEDTILLQNLAFGPEESALAALGAGLPAPPTSSRIGVDSGTGGDVVSLDDWEGGNLSLSVETGAGSDIVNIMNNKFAAPVDVFLGLGAGDDTATVESNYYNQGLNMILDAGDGRDTATIADNTYAGATLIGMLLGRGDDTATFAGNTINGVWKTNLNGGSGNDLVAVLNNMIAGSPEYYLDLGSGDDMTTMHDNQFGEGLVQKVIGGDGNDTVAFQGNNIATTPAISEIAALWDAWVDLGRGDDTATFTGNTFNGVWKTNLNGDDGNDLVSIEGNNIAADVDFFIDLGKGDDRAAFALNAYTGSLLMTVLGGDGKDLVTILCNGFGPVTLLVDLGGGRDTANVNLTLVNQDLAQHKPITVGVLGGKGDDDLTLTVKGDPEALAAANLLIDGGSGIDHGAGARLSRLSIVSSRAEAENPATARDLGGGELGDRH
jgi:hypothetical protein